MTTGGAWGETDDAILPALDDGALKMTFVLSILITILLTIGIARLFGLLHSHQDGRAALFDELTQVDKIDYLIHLFEESEKLYKMRDDDNDNNNSAEGGRNNNLDHFLDLLNELSDQLDELHDDVEYNGRSREKRRGE